MSDNDQNNFKIQDSLDNLSNIKLRQSSIQKHRSQLVQTKQRFISLLQKLQVSETREVSLSQVKKLVQQNSQPDHLRIYLSTMKGLKPNSNSTTKQHQVLVLSIMAKVFRQRLVDPVDKQPSILKTSFKLIQILLSFFNDPSNTVQQACARVLLDINQFCLVEGKHQKQQKLSILFAPLTSILRNGVDKASQATATVCVNQLVRFWFIRGQKQYLELVAKQILQVIMKINSEYQQIFMAAIVLIQHMSLRFFQNRLPNFISKILPIINSTRQGTNNLNAYMCKVNVCRLIEKVAVLLSQQQRGKLSDLNVMNSLAKAARNKNIQVQTAATRAIKAWKGEPISQDRIVQRTCSNSQNKPLKSLEQVRNQKKRQRSNSKQNTIKIQTQLNYMKQDLEKMVKGGWGANNRAKNYIKRGSGVGGGHYGQFQNSTPPKSNKSHRQHLQQLKQIIKKGSRQNKSLEKFQLIQNTGKNVRQMPKSGMDVFVQKKEMSGQQTAKNRRSPGNGYPPEYSQDEFRVQGQTGDQSVNPRLKPNMQRKKTNQQHVNQQLQRKLSTNTEQRQLANDYVIDYKQAQELLVHEDSIMGDEQKSSQHNDHNQKPNTNTPSNSKKQEHYSYQDEDLYLPLNKNQKPQRVKDQKFIKRASQIKQNLGQMATMISQDQLEQLMLQNNLSQVSQNMGDYLNESDLNDAKQGKYQLSGQYPQINTNKGQVQGKDVFMKKAAQSLKSDKNKSRFQQSLSYTDSHGSNFKQSLLPANNQSYKNNQTSSFNKASQAMREQFTLNPNNKSKQNRFQSLKRHEQDQLQQQVEQDIVESYYEESHQNGDLLPLKTKVNSPVVANSKAQVPSQTPTPLKNKQSLLQNKLYQQSQNKSKNYQELIQNPPSSNQQQKHFDRKSRINQPDSVIEQQDSNVNNTTGPLQQYQQPQQQQQLSITDQWIHILSLVQQQEINQAFMLTFDLDDPIYLIRLLILTRTPIQSLSAQNVSRLWGKFLDIYKHNFISVLFVQLFTQADQINITKSSLTIQQMQQLLVILYNVSGTSKGKLSFNAASLYNTIDQGLKGNKKRE